MSRDRNGRNHGRLGRFTAERTTRETHTREVTERLTVDDGDTLTNVLAEAPGWDPGPIVPRSLHLAQRKAQYERALYHLCKWHVSSPPGEGWNPDGGYVPVPGVGAEWNPDGGYQAPERLIREAVNILRAGPGATLMELEDGRSI
jgi:hypothetical protein